MATAPATQEYTLATTNWRSNVNVIIRLSSGRSIAHFPLDFLRTSGDFSWQYVQFVLNELIDVDGLETSIVRHGSTDGIDFSKPPEPGVYVLRILDVVGEPVFRVGPRTFLRTRPPQDGGSSETRSHSSRSTYRQSRFRMLVGVRDSQCLLSNYDFRHCEACHIAPQSQPELYETILGSDSDRVVFAPSSGVLLWKPFHSSFDALAFSFYPKDGSYYVHVFDAKVPLLQQYHGKVIPPDRFRTNDEDNLPNAELLAWHYSQCVMANIRGFAV